MRFGIRKRTETSKRKDGITVRRSVYDVIAPVGKGKKKAEQLAAKINQLLGKPSHISTEDVRHCIAGTCHCDEI